MKVIGFAGKAGSGKDFVCDVIAARFDAVRVAFADEVRYEVEEAHPNLDVWTKPYSEEVRKLLQWWGTEFRRAEDPEYWVGKAVERITAEAANHDFVIVTDVRFANEAEAIKALGGIVVEVIADDEIRAIRLGGELPPAHASEVIDFPTDAVVVNHAWPTFPPNLSEYLGRGEHYQPAKFEPTWR